ncbi:ankyrin repeat domain-containing protein [Actinomycetes bacterium KLBMP 9759]
MGGRWLRSVVGVLVGVLAVTGCAGPRASDTFTDARVVQLVDAAAAGDLAAVQRLRAEGVDLESCGLHDRTPLLWMVLTGNERGVATLLDAGADPALGDVNGDTAVHLAAELSSTRMLKLLFERGVGPSTPNTVTRRSALQNALFSERPETVTFLIESGIDVDMADRTGNTALHQAAKINQADAVLELLRAGADPTRLNAQGVTFQRFLYTTPERIRSQEFQRGIEAVERELQRQGIPIEK